MPDLHMPFAPLHPGKKKGKKAGSSGPSEDSIPVGSSGLAKRQEGILKGRRGEERVHIFRCIFWNLYIDFDICYRRILNEILYFFRKPDSIFRFGQMEKESEIVFLKSV